MVHPAESTQHRVTLWSREAVFLLGFQLFLIPGAYSIHSFIRYRRTQRDAGNTPRIRPKGVYPWLALGSGGVSVTLGAIAATFYLMHVILDLPLAWNPTRLNEWALITAGLALASAIPALGMHYRKRGVAVLGIGMIMLTLLLYLATEVLPAIGAAKSRTYLPVAVHCPRTVSIDQTFGVEVTLTNTGTTVVHVTSIDMDSSLELNWDKGLEMVGTEPAYVDYRPSGTGRHLYDYDLVVEPGETQRITFHFKARAPGVFAGLIFVDIEDERGGLHSPGQPIEITVEKTAR